MVAMGDREEREEQELRLAAHSSFALALLWVLIGALAGILLLASLRTNPQVHVLLLAVFLEAMVLRRVREAYRMYRRRGDEADALARRRAARLPRK